MDQFTTILILLSLYLSIVMIWFLKIQELTDELNFWKFLAKIFSESHLYEDDIHGKVCIHCGATEQINGQIIHRRNCPVIQYKEKVEN